MAQHTSVKHKGWKWSTADASNPTLVMVLDDTSKAVHISDASDASTDWAVSAYSHATVCIHSATTPASNYLKMWHDGTDANIDSYGATALNLGIGGTNYLEMSSSALYPTTTDGMSLGKSGKDFSDLWLDSGAVIYFDTNDVLITHASNLLTITGGGLTMGASGTPAGDFTLWGTTALYRVWFDVNGDTNGAWYFGDDDEGVDVGFYGQTSGDALTWDASAGALVATGLTKFDIGSSGTPLVLSAASHIVELYTTSAASTGNVTSMYIKQSMTGTSTANQVEALEVVLYSDVKTGAWAQAIFAQTDYGTNGLAHGAGSVICAELSLPASSVTRGTYYVWQSEIDCPANCAMNSNPIAVMSVSTWGDNKTQFDDVGLLFDISGVAVGSGKFFSTATNTVIDHALKCRIGGTTYWIGLYDATS